MGFIEKLKSIAGDKLSANDKVNAGLLINFIESHAPNKIDVHYIASDYGDLTSYLASVSVKENDDTRHVEISSHDSVSGSPIIFDTTDLFTGRVQRCKHCGKAPCESACNLAVLIG